MLLLAILTAIVCVGGTTLYFTKYRKAEPAVQTVSKVSGPDERVAKLLREMKMDYIVDKNDDFVVSYTNKNCSPITITINSSTTKYGDSEELEIRDVWAVAFASDGTPPYGVTTALLKRNNLIKLGAWSMYITDGAYIVLFRVKTDTRDLKISSLTAMIDFVATTAGGMKREIAENDGLIWSPSF